MTRCVTLCAALPLVACGADAASGAEHHAPTVSGASTASAGDPTTGSGTGGDASGPATNAGTSSGTTDGATAGTTETSSGPDTEGLGVEERDGKVKIPAGPFRIGCDSNHPTNLYRTHECHGPGGFFTLHNVPAREITLTYDYWIDKTELTRRDFADCLDAGACAREQPFLVETQYFPGEARHPMTSISWDEAKTLCEWRGGRLPTEVEWEKAARGPDFRYLPWGNVDPECDTTNAILPAECGYDAGERQVSQVDAHPKDVSPYGVLGMAGNVREWVVDFPDSDYYTTMDAIDPRPPDGPTDVPGHSVRGGYSDDGPTLAFRNYSTGPSGSLGVRCVYDQFPPPS